MAKRMSMDAACPFINRNDARCAHRFSLSRMSQAFDVCLDSFAACPIYHQLARESKRDRPGLTIRITVEGRTPPPPRHARRCDPLAL